MIKINFKQPKYIFPLVIFVPLCALIYFVMQTFGGSGTTENVVATDRINMELPEANAEEAVLVHRLLLFQRRSVRHVHCFADCPLDIVVVRRQVEKILVEKLDVRLRLHGEVSFQLCAFRKERDITVKDIDLLPLPVDQRDAAPDGEPADDGATGYGYEHRHHGESCLLCKGFYKHILSF